MFSHLRFAPQISRFIRSCLSSKTVSNPSFPHVHCIWSVLLTADPSFSRITVIQSHLVRLVLISSVSSRTGRHYFRVTRGVDPGNFNEKEQIFIATPPSSSNSNISSVAPFVRTRRRDPSTKPKSSTSSIVRLCCHDEEAKFTAAFRAHIDNQVTRVISCCF